MHLSVAAPVRRILFIDGSNLYGGMTALLPAGSYFDFADLAAVIRRILPVQEIRFYGTYMRDTLEKPSDQRLLIHAQKAFFDSAKNTETVVFHEGHFSGSGKEKGVDVRLAVDMVYGAARGLFDEAVIMTGDADLTYAVEVTRQAGIPAHLLALASRFPVAISYKANRRIVLDYQQFFTDTVLPSLRTKPRHIQIEEISAELPALQIGPLPTANGHKKDPTHNAG